MDFATDALFRAKRNNMKWYKKNLLKILEMWKEQRARDIDHTIELGRELIKILEEPVEKPAVVPLPVLVESEDDSLMKPIAPEVMDILMKSTTKGAKQRYLQKRYKTPPEDKFYFRVATSWDYGWQQKCATKYPRENHGRCALLKETFYRKNNLAPDPPTCMQPSGAEFSVCSPYQCNPN